MIAKDVGKKIHEIRRAKRLKQQDLAKLAGVTDGAISFYETGRNEPKFDVLVRIAKALEEPLDTFLEEEAKNDLKPVLLTDGNTVRLPVVSTIPCGFNDVSDLADRTEGYMDVPRFILGGGADLILRATGDSMKPTIQPGDYCIVKLMSDPINNALMVVRTDEGTHVKQVVKKKGSIELHSFNREYKPLAPKNVQIIGEVTNIIKNVRRNG